MAGSLPGAADDDRERIDDPAEVRRLLSAASASRSLCSVRPAGRPENYLGRLIGFEPASGRLSLEPPRAPYIERALAVGSDALIDVKGGERSVSFEAPVLQLDASPGSGALVLGLPSVLLMPRRREAFRISVPADLPVLLTLDEPGGWFDLQIQNLSTDGAAVSVTGPRERFEAGTLFEHARLKLPDNPPYELSLRVRHTSAVRMSGTIGELKVGVAFVRTPKGFDTAVAKLIATIARMPGPARPA
jgi:hypothetical protein